MPEESQSTGPCNLCLENRSDVKVEQKEEQAAKEEQRPAVNPVVRPACNRIHHIMRHFFETRRVRPRDVKRSCRRKPRKTAMEKRNLILRPEQEITPVAP